MLIVYFAIISMLLIMCYSLLNVNVKEGLENNDATANASYKPYNLNDPNNALILGQQNAGNIEYLKSRVEDLSGIKEQVNNIQQNMNSMQSQIDSLVQQQSDYATELVGSEPVTIKDEDEEAENGL